MQSSSEKEKKAFVVYGTSAKTKETMDYRPKLKSGVYKPISRDPTLKDDIPDDETELSYFPDEL